jgi:hypothetical protein
VGWDWVHLVRRPLIGLLYQPRMIDDECGAVGGMRIDRGNRSTRRKPALMPLCPPQIPHDLTWARTRAAAVGSWRLTAWVMYGTACATAVTLLCSVGTQFESETHHYFSEWCTSWFSQVPYSPVEVNRHFGGTCRQLFQGRMQQA